MQRGRGIGTHLLDCIRRIAAEPDVAAEDLYLHVQASDEEALRFYRKCGFVQTGVAKGYYRGRFKPPADAAVLSAHVAPLGS